MDRTTYIRELIAEFGPAAVEVLEDYGFELDEWELRQSLDTLCDDYGVEVEEVLEALGEALDEVVDEVDLDDEEREADELDAELDDEDLDPGLDDEGGAGEAVDEEEEDAVGWPPQPRKVARAR